MLIKTGVIQTSIKTLLKRYWCKCFNW